MARVAGTVKQIGQQLVGLATDLDSAGALPAGGLDAASARAQLVELVRAVLTDLGLLPASGAAAAGTPGTTPSGTSNSPGTGAVASTGTSTPAPGTSSGAGAMPGANPTTTTPSTEDTMPILFRDLAYAHARVAIDGDEVTIESSTGFERTGYTATKPPTVACHPDMPVTAAPERLALPPNTRLVRLSLSADHRDRSEGGGGVRVAGRPRDRLRLRGHGDPGG